MVKPKAAPPLPEHALGAEAGGELPLGRRLHWKPIRNVDDTIWETMLSGELSPSDFGTLKSVFREVKAGHADIANMASSSQAAAADQLILLESKRAQNIGVVVARVPVQQVAERLANLDEPLVAPEVLERLKTVLPTEEEIVCFGQFKISDVPRLRDIEQKIFPLFRLPRLSQRIRFSLVAQQLPATCAEVGREIELVTQAVAEIRNSGKLKKLLHLVLLLGNYVNHGVSGANRTRGFSIESLSKLMEFKSPSDPSITTLHFLAVRLLTSEPGLIDMYSELPSLKLASKIATESITQTIASIKRDPESIRAEVGQFSKHYSPEASAAMTQFLQSVEARIAQILAAWAACETETVNIRKFFGEDCRKISIDDFFNHLKQFFDQLASICADLRRRPKKFDKILKAEQARKSPELPSQH